MLWRHRLLWMCVWVHLSVRQPLLAPLAAAHHLVVHLHVAPTAVLSVAVVAAVWTCSWRTWWHKDRSCIKMASVPPSLELNVTIFERSQVRNSIIKKGEKITVSFVPINSLIQSNNKTIVHPNSDKSKKVNLSICQILKWSKGCWRAFT